MPAVTVPKCLISTFDHTVSLYWPGQRAMPLCLALASVTLGLQVVLFAFCFAVFVFHLRTLPFHDKIINQVRGAIHAALMWLAFTAIVVSAMKRDEERDDSSDTQNMQWAFICCIPGAAVRHPPI